MLVGPVGKVGKERTAFHDPYFVDSLRGKTKDAGQHLGGPDRPFGAEPCRKKNPATGAVQGQVRHEGPDLLDDRFPVRFPGDTEIPRLKKCADLRLEPVQFLIVFITRQNKLIRESDNQFRQGEGARG